MPHNYGPSLGWAALKSRFAEGKPVHVLPRRMARELVELARTDPRRRNIRVGRRGTWLYLQLVAPPAGIALDQHGEKAVPLDLRGGAITRSWPRWTSYAWGAGPQCSEIGCLMPAEFWYFWPGRHEPLYGCWTHAKKAVQVGEAVGMRINLYEVVEADTAPTGHEDEEEP